MGSVKCFIKNIFIGYIYIKVGVVNDYSIKQELQDSCRTLLQQEELQRAQQRHLMALRRQNAETRQQQLQENKHIMARYWNKHCMAI